MGNCFWPNSSFTTTTFTSLFFSCASPHTRPPDFNMAIMKRPLHDCRPSSKRRKGYQMRTVTDDLRRHYELGKELGRGQFGVIRHCTDKETGEAFACKSIPKAKLTSQQDAEDVRVEIEIMKHLSGHPNIVGLKNVYEDSTHVHIIMDLCEGGELFDRIVKRQSYPENEAALLIKSLVEVVKYCHEMGVMHRDLKPENILFASNSPSSPIKVADFGLALRFVPGQRFSDTAGSAYYIAPEILNCDYSNEVDLWSVGVILYVLLSGVPPFWGDTELGIFDAIRECKLDFLSDPWWRISTAAKELIRGLLNPDATTRLTSEQVLMHPWILRHTSQPANCQGKQNLDNGTALWMDVTEEFAVQNVAANRSCKIEALEEHMLSPEPFPYIEWAPRSPEPSQAGQDIMLKQGSIEAGIESLDLSLWPSGLHSAFLPSPVSSLSTLSINLVEFGQESDILPALASREFLNSSSSTSTSFCSESPSQDVFNGWMSFSEVAEPSLRELLTTVVSVLDSSALQFVLDMSPVRVQDGCTCIILTAGEEKDTLVVDFEKEKYLVVHDRERRQIGWRLLEAQDTSFVADSSTLYWSPCPAYS